MKNFVNARETLVQESIDGLLLSSGGRLTRLDGFPQIKVVLRSELNRERVALISGGGSGHEPAHAGFVGSGMLSAAVCGEVFASPSVEAVLTAIRAVTGEAGCLLIVKNYTGDRLNFGLAAERARHMGLKVEMVVVGDDVSIPSSANPRGVAGTLFVQKVAGFFAERGDTLEAVKQAASHAADSVKTMGLALTTCHPPGSAGKEALGDDEAELGLGIHGEPGVRKVPVGSARELLDLVVGGLEAEVGEGPLCVLLNNLGAVPPVEMTLLLKDFAETSLGRRTELVVGPAPLMTSYDMNGFSLTAMPLTDELREAMVAEVGSPFWPKATNFAKAPLVAPPETEFTPAPASDDAVVGARLSALLQALVESRDDLNALDAKVGDGDAGDTFANAAAAITQKFSELPLAEPDSLLAALSASLGHAGGSSGILLAIFTGAASSEYHQRQDWLSALDYGLERMRFYGGASPGDRTMLDALIPGLQALKNGDSFAQAAAKAREGANATAGMSRASAGRSSYLNADTLQGVVDPGAEAVARAFEALARS